MRIEDIVVVATVREEIRGQRPFVDAGIERRIEAAQVKVVAHDDDDDSESEGKAEHVADTISKVGGGKSATYPYPVFPGGVPSQEWPWSASATRVGVPMYPKTTNVGASSVTPPSGPVPPVPPTAQGAVTPLAGFGIFGKKEQGPTLMGSASGLGGLPSVVVESTGGSRPAVPTYPQWPLSTFATTGGPGST